MELVQYLVIAAAVFETIGVSIAIFNSKSIYESTCLGFTGIVLVGLCILFVVGSIGLLFPWMLAILYFMLGIRGNWFATIISTALIFALIFL